MNITPEQQLVLDKICEYFNGLGYKNIIVYGSYIEQFHGFTVQPNDIDITLVIDEEPPPICNKTFYLEFIDLPINVEIMHRKSFDCELSSMQPKYFICICNPGIQKDIEISLNSKLPHEIRSCISSISSKAFNKGKKKLTIEDDYNEILGLKNIFHAFKFPYYAKWRYYPDDHTVKNKDIAYLNEIRHEMYELYKNSAGTLDERCQVVLDYAKEKHNAIMTEFRILFPKEIKS